MADVTPTAILSNVAVFTQNLTSSADLDEVDKGLLGVWALIDIILFLAITGGNLLTITAILRRYTSHFQGIHFFENRLIIFSKQRLGKTLLELTQDS